VTPHQIAGAVVSIAGVFIIVVRGDSAMLRGMILNVGDLWILLAVCFWAAQTIVIRLVPREIDLVAFQVASFVIGLGVLTPLYFCETASGKPMPLTPHAAVLVGYAGVMASAVGLTCWNLGVLRVGPQTASYFGNLFPVFGAALGILLLAETFAWYHVAGAVLTLGGIYLATAYHRAHR
jgi:drug/metabolite transporter (DMT)-like permease